MKRILLLHDEARQPTRLLQNAVPARVPIREIETVASCNCDRWGHPCPGCVERVVVQPKPDLPISIPTKK
jgi:hypothetical protein